MEKVSGPHRRLAAEGIALMTLSLTQVIDWDLRGTCFESGCVSLLVSTSHSFSDEQDSAVQLSPKQLSDY
jgi:hypothetical protein